LGRYLIDGIQERQFHIALVGAVMVAALALILDGLLALAVWASVPGTGRLSRVTRVADRQAHPSKVTVIDKAAVGDQQVLR
jgi:osmoprotectant transport system permease protein